MRKSTSELRTADAMGRSRTVQVEVRKKRVLVTRTTETAAPIAAAFDTPSNTAKPLLSAEEVAARQAEARRGDALREIQANEQQQKYDRVAALATASAATDAPTLKDIFQQSVGGPRRIDAAPNQIGQGGEVVGHHERMWGHIQIVDAAQGPQFLE